MSVVPEHSINYLSQMIFLTEVHHDSFLQDQIMNPYPKSNVASPQHKSQSHDIFHKF